MFLSSVFRVFQIKNRETFLGHTALSLICLSLLTADTDHIIILLNFIITGLQGYAHRGGKPGVRWSDTIFCGEYPGSRFEDKF